jgi:6-phosphogluconate dehydrogenase
MVGLGKMGGNMAERLRRGGHEVVGFDRSSPNRDVTSLPELVEALSAPRVVWVMVPSGEPTKAVVKELSELLSPGDVVIEGGNSKYTDDQVHDVLFREKNLGYVDAGVSGGVWGLENGYALMVGGTKDDIAKVQPIFDTLKPPAPKDESGQEMPGAGFVHAGPVGAGHLAGRYDRHLAGPERRSQAESPDVTRPARTIAGAEQDPRPGSGCARAGG